jgi:hypothetical protein
MLTAPVCRLHDLSIASRPPHTDAYADDALFHPPLDIMPHMQHCEPYISFLALSQFCAPDAHKQRTAVHRALTAYLTLSLC